MVFTSEISSLQYSMAQLRLRLRYAVIIRLVMFLTTIAGRYESVCALT